MLCMVFVILEVGWRWCYGKMDVPAVNTSFTHPQPQTWAGQNHMTPAMSPTSWKPNPTCPPPYHYPYMNPTHQSTGVSLAPMTHTPVTCSGARPQSLYWDNSHQSYQGKNNRKPNIGVLGWIVVLWCMYRIMSLPIYWRTFVRFCFLISCHRCMQVCSWNFKRGDSKDATGKLLITSKIAVIITFHLL